MNDEETICTKMAVRNRQNVPEISCCLQILIEHMMASF